MDTEALAAFTEWTFKFTDGFSATGGHPLHGGNQGAAGHDVQCGAGQCGPSQPRRPRSARSRDHRPRRPAACSSPPTASSASSPHHEVRKRPVSLQRARHDLPELVGRLQERRLQPALQRRASRQCADFIWRRNGRVISSLASSSNPSDRLRINVAVFTTDYDDIQMTYRLGVVPLLFNAGAAKIEGGEIELACRPMPGFPARYEPWLSNQV